MLKVYYMMVKRNLRTIDQIPESFREGVQELLDEDDKNES